MMDGGTQFDVSNHCSIFHEHTWAEWIRGRVQPLPVPSRMQE
jgi:hypothetical protein